MGGQLVELTGSSGCGDVRHTRCILLVTAHSGFPEHCGPPPPHVLSRVFLSTLGIHDTSGMRLYYTSHLRKYDMGVLQLGISVFPIHFIPPGAEAFLSYGLCKTEKFEEVKLRRAFLEAPCLSVRVLARSLNSRSRATNLKND